jgi:RNA polymerase sigma-70 factor (ECF subfamily)
MHRDRRGRRLVATRCAVLDQRFVLRAIAALHAERRAAEIIGLRWCCTTCCCRSGKSPVVALNRAAALSMKDGRWHWPGQALERDVARRVPVPATKADLLRRLGRLAEAAVAYRAALELAENQQEREFLAGRLAEVGSDTGSPG